MIYEYRRYEAASGQLEQLSRRFEELTQPLFKRHGVDAIGYWTMLGGSSNEFHYVLRWPDLGPSREDAEERVRKDPEWIARRGDYGGGAPLVVRYTHQLWTPTTYSPLS